MPPKTSQRITGNRRVWWSIFAAGAFVSLFIPSCSSAAPEGLRHTPEGPGPRIVFDPETRPFPDMPFPNDFATRYDPGSPTGRRINVGTAGRTRLERSVRTQLNGLDGFGTYAPITVSFNAPVDLDSIIDRHQRNLDFADDAVFVVDITEGSPTYGEPVLLDMGRGHFPSTLRPDTTYFPGDAREGGMSLLFETANEDLDGDGQLDPGEDTDGDGLLDRPNVWPPGAPPEEGLLTWFELQSNTMILRPLRPLRERTEYAVVLTERILGVDGNPIRSPFPYINHVQQTPSLKRLNDVFARWVSRGWSIGIHDVAFTWSFTTQTVTADLVAIREGLYGEGSLAWLKDAIPPNGRPALSADADSSRSPYVVEGGTLREISKLAFGPMFELTDEQVGAVVEDMDHIDYLVQGYYDSPDFLSSEVPLFDMTFDIDVRTGHARMRPERVTFILTVPKATSEHGPPFPVAIYAHGFGQARLEPLGFAGILARYGVASLGIDAWGHGVNLKKSDQAVVKVLGGSLGVLPFAELMLEGRARDLDGDGRVDAGADTFSAYAFHTRDTVRQSVVDHLQAVRMLREFDGVDRWELDQDADGVGDLRGDFDGDGRVDVGGPEASYFIWGSSMGGIHSTVIGAIEPAIRASVPISGGAGLTQLTSRSLQSSVRTDTVMRAMGPVVSGLPVDGLDAVDVSYYFPLATELVEMPVGRIEGLRPLDRVELINVDKGWSEVMATRADRSFALHLRADVGDRFEVRVERGGQRLARLTTWSQDVVYGLGEEPTYRAGEVLRSPGEGWGFGRGSTELRRMLGLAQMVLEPADPINYTRHYTIEPLPIRPEGPTPTNILIVATVGDMLDPSDVQVAKAVGAGVLDPTAVDPRYGRPAVQWLIDQWVLEGICGFGRFPPNEDGTEVLFDPDALDRLSGGGGNGFGAPQPPVGSELRATVNTGGGQSGMRWGHMLPCGKHSFFVTDPANAFNVDEYLASMAGHYFRSDGKQILDDGCHEDSSCPLMAR